jgi:hypothetical protein
MLKKQDAEKNVNDFLTLEENFDAQVDNCRKTDEPGPLLIFLKKELPKISKKSFNYIVLYMERALEVLCDYNELWELYLDFINTNGQSNLKLPILKRATRCSYSEITLWVQLFKEMEKNQFPVEELTGKYRNITSIAKVRESYSNCPDPEFRYEAWKYLLEYYVRNYNGNDLEVIRATFEGAINEVSSKDIDLTLGYSKAAEMLERVYYIWVEFEVYKVGRVTMDSSKMREIMEIQVRKIKDPDVWERYISYEKFFGDNANTRKIFKRAIEYSTEHKDKFTQSYIQWEKM